MRDTEIKGQKVYMTCQVDTADECSNQQAHVKHTFHARPYTQSGESKKKSEMQSLSLGPKHRIQTQKQAVVTHSVKWPRDKATGSNGDWGELKPAG